MDKEWALARFFALLGFFEGAMSGVVLSDSLFQSYFLLEMLTLSTYLLVGFWYAQPLVVTAARDAFLTKRVGDVLLLMGVVALCSFSGVMGFGDLYAWAAQNNLTSFAATLLGLGLIAGPTGKCAQFPMHLWLDEAMEGPNPASILRNSVVVTCGAIVLLKVMPILQLSPVALAVLLVIGSISAIGGSLVAIAQVDIKDPVVLNNGPPRFGVYRDRVAIPVLALLLLYTHAVSKALLSMSVGGVIASQTVKTSQAWGTWQSNASHDNLPSVGGAGLVAFFLWVALTPVVRASSCWRPLRPSWRCSCHHARTSTGQVFCHALHVHRPRAADERQMARRWQRSAGGADPVLLVCLESLDGLLAFPLWAAALVVGSGLIGLVAGAVLPLSKAWSRSLNPLLRWFQDLLAYDFYTERFYRITIVNVVAGFSRLAFWFDRNVVDGVLHGVARLSMQSAEGLKLSVSGQSQSYVLTVLVAIVLFLTSVSWFLT